MSKAKVKYIPIDIYKRCIYIFIGSLDEFKLWVKNTYTYDKEKEFVEMVLRLTEDTIGMASFNWDSAGGTGVVLIPKMPKTPKETAALIHELMHATFCVLDFCQMDYNPNGSNEAFTYLMEHLTRNALEKEGYEEVEFKI
jgi:hypothetical protein